MSIVNNFGVDMVVARPVRRRRSVIDAESLRGVTRRFVRCEGLIDSASGCGPSALEILLSRHFTVLSAPSHSGHRWAMRRLADELLNTRLLVRGVSTLTPDPECTMAEAADGSGSRTLWLVDIVEAEQFTVDSVREQLAEFAGPLVEHDAYLVVAVPSWAHERFDEDYPDRVRALTRPDPMGVFRAALDRVPERLGEELAARAEVMSWLRDAWPPAAARLARLASDFLATTSEITDDLVQQLLDADSDWSRALRGCFAEFDARHRCLLIAAAALEGKSPRIVVDAADALLSRSGYRYEWPHELDRDGTVTELESLGARLFDPTVMRFVKPGFGMATLIHVVTEHPWLAPTLWEWLAEIPLTLTTPNVDELERFTDRLLEIVTAADSVTGLDRLVRQWVTRGDGRSTRVRLSSLAVRLLTAAEQSERFGWRVRRWLYDWAYDSRASTPLKLLAARVCGEDFGRQSPTMALTRLRHLASSGPEVVDEVVRAIDSIGAHIGTLPLVRRLLYWLDKPARQVSVLVRWWMGWVRTGRFTTVLLSPENDGVIVEFLGGLAENAPLEEFGKAVQALLGEAALPDDDRLVTAVVELLVGVVRREPRHAGALYFAAGMRGDRGDGLLRRLLTRMDEVDPMHPNRIAVIEEVTDAR